MGAFLRLLGAAVEALYRIPKHVLDDGSPNPNYMTESDMWRKTIAGGITLALLVGLLAIGLASYTFLVSAKAADTNAVILEIKEGKIQERHKDYCDAEMGSPQKSYYLGRRNSIISEWEQIAGRRFDYNRLPNCAEL